MRILEDNPASRARVCGFGTGSLTRRFGGGAPARSRRSSLRSHIENKLLHCSHSPRQNVWLLTKRLLRLQTFGSSLAGLRHLRLRRVSTPQRGRFPTVFFHCERRGQNTGSTSDVALGRARVNSGGNRCRTPKPDQNREAISEIISVDPVFCPRSEPFMV